MHPIKQRFLVLIIAGLSLLPFWAKASEMVLQDFSGAYKSLSDYTGKGKWTVVMLWASDCMVCNKEAHQYVAFHEKHKNTNATVLGVSLDGNAKKKEAQEFLDRHKVSFPSLIGEPVFVANGFQEITGEDFRGTPTFLIYGPDGKIQAQQAGAVPTDLIESFIAQESSSTTAK